MKKGGRGATVSEKREKRKSKMQLKDLTESVNI